MANIISGIQIVGNFINNIINDKKDALDINPDIETHGKVTRLMSKYLIVPNVVIDERLQMLDKKIMQNLIKTQMMTYTSLVVQAFRVMVEVHGVTPEIAVDRMSSSSLLDDIRELEGLFAGNNSLDYVDNVTQEKPVLPGLLNEEYNGSTVTNNNFTQKDIQSFVNNYEVQLNFTDIHGVSRVVTIPLIIYPNITFKKIEPILKNRLGKDLRISNSEIFMDYAAGIQSFTDLIFATKIVEEYAEGKLGERSDFAEYLNKIDNIGNIKDIIQNKRSFNRNFNIYIFAQETEQLLDKLVRGSIYKDKYKDKITDALLAFAVTLVDVDEEKISYHLDSIPNFSILDFEMLAKEKDADMSKLVASMASKQTLF